MQSRRVAAALLVLAVAPAPGAQLPGEFEAGIGALAIRLPAYRGSDDSRVRYLPVPFLFYRLNRLEVSRRGMRAQVFESERVDVGLSVSADLPSNDSGGIRQGMPRLLPTFGAGPSLDLQLWRDPGGTSGRLRLPLRVIAATDLSDWDYAGWLFNPHLRMDRRVDVAGWTTNLRGTLGPLWATREYHDYFYSIDPAFATPPRPTYDAGGGYSGFRFSGGWSFARDRWRYSLFASYDYLGGAAFEDSPLVVDPHAAGAGIVISYRLWPRRSAVDKDEGP